MFNRFKYITDVIHPAPPKEVLDSSLLSTWGSPASQAGCAIILLGLQLIAPCPASLERNWIYGPCNCIVPSPHLIIRRQFCSFLQRETPKLVLQDYSKSKIVPGRVYHFIVTILSNLTLISESVSTAQKTSQQISSSRAPHMAPQEIETYLPEGERESFKYSSVIHNKNLIQATVVGD